MRKRFRVKNLDCRGCAARIDEALNDLPEVKRAYLDFDQALLVVDSGTMTVDKVNSLVNSIEPGALVEKIKDDGKGNSSGILIPTHLRVEHLPALVRILASALIFTAGMIFRDPLSQTAYGWGEYTVFLSAYLICGSRVLLTALKNIMSGRVFDEFFLMSLATLTAILIGQLPEAVGVMLFYRTGELFQDIAASRSRRSVRSLLADRPSEAFRIEGESIEKVSPEEVKPGERILVRPGEKIPLDGVIRRGSTQVDQSALTGESVPVLKGEGNEIFGGSVNMEGTITVEVTAPFEETAVARIMELVEFAASRKSPTERFITRFARYYTPAVVLLATGVAFLPPLAGFGTYSEWIYRALVLLVISCPCALMVSVPLGYFGGIGAASRSGILVKGGNILDALTSVSAVILDKTGTVTKGVFEVVSVKPADGVSRKHLLKAARLAEGFSNHPVARSIATAAPGIVVPGTALTTDQPGRGVITVIDGDRYAAGNDKLMAELGIETQAPEQTAGTLLNVAFNDSYLGRITVSDVIKEETRTLAGRLKNLGVSSILMLTGDRKNVAQSVASEIGLDGYLAELFPHEKVAQLEKWKEEHEGKVIFAGDGINDAPSIASADIGVAMGGLGSEAAIEIADVVILDDSPSKIGDIISIAKKTRNLVWQNIFLALSVKLLILALGIAGMSSLWEAVFADVGVTLLAVLNSARAIRFTGGRI